MEKLIAILAALALAVPCSAKVLTVDDNGPADHRTIQAAINSAWHGDTVVVRQGIYPERITFNGRRITVRTEKPGDPMITLNTVISADSDASVVFNFGESSESVLSGFTITKGGILCTATSPTISMNSIRSCSGVAIKGQNNAKPTILGNEIIGNTLEGIYSCDGLIQDNVIHANLAGLAFCNGSILANVIAGNGDAGGLYSCNGEIAYNSIKGNYSAANGGGLISCAGDIHNNVIAGNRALRQGGGLYDCTNSIYNNTIVGNRAGDVGGALGTCPATVYNNIIAFNEAFAAGGVHGQCTNTYNVFWANVGGDFGGGLISGLGDMAVDPLFALNGRWDDKGTAKIDDDSWVDGDYHLQSQAGRWDAQKGRWVTDRDTSLCIDAGRPSSNWAAELWPHGKRINIGTYGGTAQASLSSSSLGRLADLDHDEKVGPRDLTQFCLSWQSGPDPMAADLNRKGAVDFNDFAILAMDWRKGSAPQGPPIPSPMTFAAPPYATGPYSMAMVATMASSTDGTGVEYYFEDYFAPEINSGWRSYGPGQEPRWEDTGLQPERLYWYRVKARNKGNRLETEWSERLAEETLREDFDYPTPNPMTWQTEPYGVSGGTIRMVATTAVDVSGVEYEFECTSHPAYSSGWQDSPSYDRTGLPKGYYRFRVRARDKSPNHNLTQWSAEVTVDLLAPAPDPMQWETQPKKIRKGTGSLNYHATMTAMEATDDSGDVEYYFECTNESGFSSKWQKERTYTVLLGGQHVYAKFRVKARDTSPSHNETGWSSELPAQ